MANRIKEIKLVENQTWRYCSTENNPADLLTRRMTAKNFAENKLWRHGPQWITKESDWDFLEWEYLRKCKFINGRGISRYITEGFQNTWRGYLIKYASNTRSWIRQNYELRPL